MAKPKVLIIDDDEDLHTLYRLYLQGEDIEIIDAFNGEEGLKKVLEEPPDLIVLDMIMPVMDGEQFFVALRVEKKITDIPVIIASVNEKIPQKLHELGLYSTLKKPFTIEILVEKVKAALHL